MKKDVTRRWMRRLVRPLLFTMDALIAWTGYREWDDLRQETNQVLEHPFMRTMKLCPICGNKRCPKATDEKLDCTNSNEPGQPGSAY